MNTPFNPFLLGGLIRKLKPSEVWQVPDVGGSLAIANAATDLINGQTVRFARVKHDGRRWNLVNVVRLVVVPETDPERRENGYGDMIRLHDHDGDPEGVNSSALGLYDLAKHSHAEIAVAIALCLSHNDTSFARLAGTALGNPFKPTQPELAEAQ